MHTQHSGIIMQAKLSQHWTFAKKKSLSECWQYIKYGNQAEFQTKNQGTKHIDSQSRRIHCKKGNEENRLWGVKFWRIRPEAQVSAAYLLTGSQRGTYSRTWTEALQIRQLSYPPDHIRLHDKNTKYPTNLINTHEIRVKEVDLEQKQNQHWWTDGRVMGAKTALKGWKDCW